MASDPAAGISGRADDVIVTISPPILFNSNLNPAVGSAAEAWRVIGGVCEITYVGPLD